MEKRWTRRDFVKGVAGVAGTLAVAGSLPKAWAKDSIKVGVHTPLSGIIAADGISMLNGIKLWAEEINGAGGLLGQPVELVVEDNESDPKVGHEKAKKLLAKKVAVVFGPITSAMRNATAPVVTGAGKILVYPTFYEGGACNKNLFVTGEVPAEQLDLYIPWIVKNYGKGFYIVGSDYVYPRKTNEQAKVLLAKQGGKVVNEEYVALGTTEFSSLINRIRTAKPEVLFCNVVGTDGITLSKQFYSYGLTKSIQQCSTVHMETYIAGIGKEAAEGIISSFAYFMTIDTPRNKKFVADFQKLAGKDALVTTITEAMYVGAYLWALGVKQTGTTDTNKVRAAMETLTFDAPEGQVKVRKEDHHCWKNSRIAQVKNAEFQIIANLGLLPPGENQCKKV